MEYEDKIINDMRSQRLGKYPDLAEQLDMLWHDIDSGLFGDEAKKGSWFSLIKDIKDEYPTKGVE